MKHSKSSPKSTPVNMLNRKPYRTAEQKVQARASAVKCADGAWRSNAPFSMHTKPATQFS